MTQFFCPRCQQRLTVAWGVTDYVHDCDGPVTTLRQEDVLVLGNWNDYTGSIEDFNRRYGPYQGIGNKLAGTRAAIEGGKNEDRTARGNPITRYRSRQHKEYIDLKNVRHKRSTAIYSKRD